MRTPLQFWQQQIHRTISVDRGYDRRDVGRRRNFSPVASVGLCHASSKVVELQHVAWLQACCTTVPPTVEIGLAGANRSESHVRPHPSTSRGQFDRLTSAGLQEARCWRLARRCGCRHDDSLECIARACGRPHARHRRTRFSDAPWSKTYSKLLVSDIGCDLRTFAVDQAAGILGRFWCWSESIMRPPLISV